MAFKKVRTGPEAAPKPKPQPKQAPQEAPPEQHNVPVHKISMYPVEAAIWLNYSQDGRSMYSVSFQRSYKDKAGEWHRTTSYSGSDLLVLSLVALESYKAIERAKREDRAAEVGRPQGQRQEVTDDDVPF